MSVKKNNPENSSRPGKDSPIMKNETIGKVESGSDKKQKGNKSFNKSGTIQVNIDEQHPYLGLSTFEEIHKDYFFGRSSEIAQLLRLVRRSVLTVFFGKSGLGKSSLLRAGLFPELRSDYYLPIYIRINFSQCDQLSALEQVKEKLQNEILAHDPEALKMTDLSLWEYFHIVTILNGMVTPVLVFDQFEEVFTLGRRAQFDELFSELSNLIENRVPMSVQEKYGNRPLPFAHKEQAYKVIFSLREDYLPHLENLNELIPSLRMSRLRLKQLSAKHAYEAVYEPARKIIEKEEAQKIVDLIVTSGSGARKDEDLAIEEDYEIEPFLLSLICERINHHRFDDSGIMIEEKISSSILEKIHIKDIVESFYEESIEGSSAELNEFIEKQLLTSDGYRRLQPMADAIDVHHVPQDEIQTLINKRILRKENWRGREQVELIHDVLVPVVRKKRRKREAMERNAELQEVLRVQKKKNLQRTIIIGFVLAFLSGFFVYLINRQSIKEDVQYLNIGQQLAYISKSKGYSELRLKGLLARYAYNFTIGHGGKIDNQIYYALYESLQFLNGSSFQDDYKFLSNKGNIENKAEGLREFVLLDSVMITAHKNGHIILWILDQQLPKINQIGQVSKNTYSMTVDVIHQKVYVGGRYNFIYVYDLGGTHKKDSILISGTTNQICVDSERNRMFSGGDDGIIYSWEMKESVRGMSASRDSLELLRGKKINALASYNDMLAIGTRDSSVYIYSLIDRDTTRVIIKDRKSGPTSLCFSPDGSLLIIGNQDGNTISYSIKDKSYRSIQYHTGIVTDIEFQPKGKLMATSSSDGNVVIWDSNTNEVMLILKDEFIKRQPVRHLEFDNSGEHLYVGYDDGIILRWPLNFENMANEICHIFTKNSEDPQFSVDRNGDSVNWNNVFTQEEWTEYIGDKFSINSNDNCSTYK